MMALRSSSLRYLARNISNTPRYQIANAFTKSSRFYSASEFGGKKDSGFNAMNFVVVALIGTGIFGVVVHKVDEQDSAKSMLKRKNTFTDQEWEQYMNSIKRKVLLFKPSTEIYFIPNPKSKEVSQLTKSIGSDKVKVVDLNEVIKDEIENHADRYGTLLQHHLISQAGASYEFDKKLAKGIFTKLMRLRLEELRNASSAADDQKYLLVNFPNNIQEAIKFESDVAVVRKLVLFDEQKSDISDYFETVHKVARVKKVNDASVEAIRKV